MFSKWNESDVGVIIRDDKGLVVAALSKKIGAPVGALEVEANTFEVGVLKCIIIDYKNIH